MTQDVRQWLAEIKLLQQKLVEAQQERDEAYASASKWRSLYETEAKQRRTDASLARQTVEHLKTEIDRLRSLPEIPDSQTADRSAAEQEVAQLQTTAALQERLTQALLEIDRLAQALKAEQTDHTKTRKSLTTALGDTVDLLTKERADRGTDQGATPSSSVSYGSGIEPVTSSNGSIPHLLELRNPSLELPRLD
jgi:hypothetical protein